MTALAATLAILAIAVFAWLVITAPNAFEDDTGFHLGSPHDPQQGSAQGEGDGAGEGGFVQHHGGSNTRG
jgi:hypothetical protein